MSAIKARRTAAQPNSNSGHSVKFDDDGSSVSALQRPWIKADGRELETGLDGITGLKESKCYSFHLTE